MKKEKAKSKEVKAKNQDIDNDFLDDENDDKRLIVFIAIAILVIIATIIGLLVGCEKEEQEEPEKPIDEIVVPEEEDDEKEEEKELPVVKKVTTVKKKKVEHNVTFYINGNVDTIKVTDGRSIGKYEPAGYNNCKYYTDETMSSEFDISSKIKKDEEIYLSCNLIEYSIIYDTTNYNPTTYNVEEEDYILSDPYITDGFFQGWYTSKSYDNNVTKLSKDLVKYANSNNEIYLYARITYMFTVNYYDDYYNQVDSEEISSEESQNYVLKAGSDNYCHNGERFLGWSLSVGNKNIENDTLSINLDTDLHAVCGSARVVFKSGNEQKVVGYTESELNNKYEDLPTPQELGMEIPTYFVEVEEDNVFAKKVVSDDKEDFDENTEVRLKDVQEKAGTSYENPEIGDFVEEKEKVFKGWKETEINELPEEELNEPVDGSIQSLEPENTSPQYTQELNGETNTDVQNEDTGLNPQVDTQLEEVEDEPPKEPSGEIIKDEYYQPEDNSETVLEAVWEEQPEDLLEEVEM